MDCKTNEKELWFTWGGMERNKKKLSNFLFSWSENLKTY